MNLAEILKKENIEIEENIENVYQYGTMNLDDIEEPEDFNRFEYYADNLDNEYEVSETTYTIYQNNIRMDKSFTEEDVKDFLKSLKEKYEV